MSKINKNSGDLSKTTFKKNLIHEIHCSIYVCMNMLRKKISGRIHIKLLTVYLGGVELGQDEGSALTFKFIYFHII